MLKIFLPIICFAFLTALSLKNETVIDISVSNDTLQYPEEHHFKNMRQLTFGGDNAEAYFSFDGKYIVFQRTDPSKGIMCDQIWMGKIPESADEEFYSKISKHRYGPHYVCIIFILMESIFCMPPRILAQRIVRLFLIKKK